MSSPVGGDEGGGYATMGAVVLLVVVGLCALLAGMAMLVKNLPLPSPSVPRFCYRGWWRRTRGYRPVLEDGDTCVEMHARSSSAAEARQSVSTTAAAAAAATTAAGESASDEESISNSETWIEGDVPKAAAGVGGGRKLSAKQQRAEDAKKERRAREDAEFLAIMGTLKLHEARLDE
jgi:hypothetical protein